jgi:hypothetical protein
MSLRVKARAVETVKVIYPVRTIPLEEDLAMASNGSRSGTNLSPKMGVQGHQGSPVIWHMVAAGLAYRQIWELVELLLSRWTASCPTGLTLAIEADLILMCARLADEPVQLPKNLRSTSRTSRLRP